ncbi:MAG: regulatory protein RecX [Sneathiella sp.]|nr:regulatory protein RecX [Sneathiella sp.]
MMEDEEKPKKRAPRPPKPVTPARVREQALRYLDRFAATTDKLKRHLMTKNRRAIQHHSQDEEEVFQMIEETVEKIVKQGLMDDQKYADAKARSLSRQGKSTRHIRQKLFSLGLNEGYTEHALEELTEVEGYTDLIGAAKYVRKRKFGPYKEPDTREERRDKELGALMRNGYSFEIATKILSLETVEELEDIIFGTGDYHV